MKCAMGLFNEMLDSLLTSKRHQMYVEQGNMRVMFLGDLVGYGLDPRFTQLALRVARIVDVLLGTWGGEVELGLRAEVLRRGVKIKQFQFPINRNFRFVGAARELSRVFEADRIDVVHCQCYRELLVCACASTLSERKPALVFTDHNSLGWRGIGVIPRLTALAVVQPHLIDIGNHFARIPFLRGSAVWIPNGVDTSYFKRTLHPIRRSGIVSLIYPARLERNKGHVDLLHVCSSMKRKGLRFRVVLAGRGPELEHLQKLAVSLDLAHVVQFAGHLSREELLKELLAADIGVFPSYAEMMPVAVLEMMAAALPVVAYQSGSIPRIIRHNDTGFIARCRSKSDFEHYVMALVKNIDLARTMGSRAASDARVRFDLSVVAQQIADFYGYCARRLQLPARSFVEAGISPENDTTP